MSAAELKFHECIGQLLSFLRWKQIQFNPQDNQSLVLFRQIRRRERLEYPYTLIEAEYNFIQSLFRDENLLLTESVCHTRGRARIMSVKLLKYAKKTSSALSYKANASNATASFLACVILGLPNAPDREWAMHREWA